MLTRPEFLKGWLFLTAQPWGKAYRSGTIMSSGEPDPASLQSEFYYRAFTQTTPDIWYKACQTAAQGEHWPSIDTLRQFKNLSPTVPGPTVARLGGIFYTKQEFGVALYDVIATIGGILGLHDQIAGVIHREEGHRLQDLKHRRDALRSTLAQQLPALTDVEMGTLLERYPIVPTL